MRRFLSLLLVLGLALSVTACGGKKRPSLAAREGEGHESENEGRRGGRGEERAEEPEAPRPEGPIKINEVTADELAAYKIAGVGQATAENIIAYRDENGPFRSFEDLDKAPRVGPSMLEKFKAAGIDFGAAAAAVVAETVPAAGVPQAATAAAGGAPATGAAPAGGSAPAPVAGAKVNVNRAGIEELCTLKRIGPALAQRIIDYRTANGPFKSLEDLDKVSGIGPALLEGVRDQVTF